MTRSTLTPLPTVALFTALSACTGGSGTGSDKDATTATPPMAYTEDTTDRLGDTDTDTDTDSDTDADTDSDTDADTDSDTDTDTDSDTATTTPPMPYTRPSGDTGTHSGYIPPMPYPRPSGDTGRGTSPPPPTPIR